ncbi:MAG: hypothetical protein DKINENOH_04523 [bacterium]|nr:hypothetical protein [bacterium]
MASQQTKWIAAAAVAVLALIVATGVWYWNRHKTAAEKPGPAAAITDVLPQPSVTPPPAPVDEPRPTVVSSSEGIYTVQVSSWQSRRNAEADAKRYEGQGHEVYIQRANIPAKGGIWYRVRIGRFATKEEAEALADNLVYQLQSGYWLDRVRQDQ